MKTTREPPTSPSAKKPRAVRLKSLEDVRRFVAGLCNEVKSGTLDPQVAAKQGYLAGILVSILKEQDLQAIAARLDAVEQKQRGGT
ncbi:hypothetical protein [Desulfopila aestuarii]|uniref:Uncharacterized protein n=1 Tax=Desulfopila aestuarii DSM 18488 TaxID=1121416 RepID=A0A1M7YFI1_9BACT|nr:hypothetical protein [Desulfopila aestuarii]SHO51407.1 hypothetical protein SAMN02745220_03990 [Desulfopila aestuarii DSM 18488]